MWRLCSAIHGSTNFQNPRPTGSCVLRRGLSEQHAQWYGSWYRRGCPKMSEAMDGRREAHMDVLVAVFGQPLRYQLLLRGKKEQELQNITERNNDDTTGIYNRRGQWPGPGDCIAVCQRRRESLHRRH